MWIRDHHNRLVNSENVIHFSIVDAHKEKRDDKKLWVIAARTVKADWNTPRTLWLTEGFVDKEEALIRLQAIEDGLEKEIVKLILE